jgi:UDP-N-acetylglucosamine 2-epimerase (non-hydrolysing)
MNLLIAYGTRPEWIKIKPVIDAISGHIPFKILFTGQHTSLVDSTAREYNTIDLEIEDLCDMRLDSIVASTLKSIPSNMYGATHVMVQGDTSTAFAVALAAFHRQIPVIHLEAGLRTYDNENPYPEEFNRAAITALADIHLCPTVAAVSNVYYSRPNSKKVFQTGNTVLDPLVGVGPVEVQDFVLVTMHRRENQNDIANWFDQLNIAAGRSSNRFIFPMHPSPAVQKYKDILSNVEVIDPLGHTDCIDMIRRCKYVITDSGGIQEESAFLKKKCIVCRKTTERAEGIDTFAFMCPESSSLAMLSEKLENQNDWIVDKPCPYGDGHASKAILDILKKEMFK